MSELCILRSETHKHLKIDTRLLPELGYGTSAVMLMPNEIEEAQRDFPLILRKHPDTGEFFVLAMLGFEEGQNLFLDGHGDWLAAHLPFAFSKGPFMIGFQGDPVDGGKRVLSVDMADPRANVDAGEAVFDMNGGTTSYLNSVNATLAAMDEGMRALKPFIEKLSELDLIEPLKVEARFRNGEKANLSGAYTLADEKLRELKPEQLQELNMRGYLKLAYYISGSLGNLKKLVDLKDKKDKQESVFVN